jgi:DNA-directed RNA polymerase specialized sigma24 family protein
VSSFPAKKNKSNHPFAKLRRICLRCWPDIVGGDLIPVRPRSRWLFLCSSKIIESTSRSPVQTQSVTGSAGSQIMPLEFTCGCTLCNIESYLVSDLSRREADASHELFSGSKSLCQYSSVSTLLLHLRASLADARSDELLCKLFASRQTNPAFIESILVLAFLPMLHGTIRRVGRQQPGLAHEDTTQQALSFLLQYLRSDELQIRQSHFAFAISRAVKRRVFEWANREGSKTGLLRYYDGETFAALAQKEPFERYALLRHFLHRCVTKGLLTDAELHLLIQFKLNGTSGEELADFNGTSSNAVRQRLKRLLAKLRRLAR